MRSHLTKCKPQVFECDTTFVIQVEGCKLYIPLFHSNHTDKWEVAGILFLSTETKEKVHAGVKFFKACLPYKIDDGVTKFIFFTDKDFDYIEVGKYILYMSRCTFKLFKFTNNNETMHHIYTSYLHAQTVYVS